MSTTRMLAFFGLALAACFTLSLVGVRFGQDPARAGAAELPPPINVGAFISGYHANQGEYEGYVLETHGAWVKLDSGTWDPNQDDTVYGDAQGRGQRWWNSANFITCRAKSQ